MSKTFPICKWIYFAISTFAIVEETPSGISSTYVNDKQLFDIEYSERNFPYYLEYFFYI